MESNNAKWLERFEKIMPWGSGTVAKAISYAPEEPAVITHGKGCRVWDADGREFIDFKNALGPITLGYGYPQVNAAIIEQLEKGIIFSQPTPLECEVAEMFCKMIPCAEKARFIKTGGEACAAAIRIARAYTERDYIIQIGYTGWLNSVGRGTRVLPGRVADGYPGGVPAGIGELTLTAGWNETEKITQLFDQYKGKIAAVFLACAYDNVEAGKTFYPFLRKITQDNGALLMCDEIVMGMRISYGGAHEYFGVTPDLIVLSKGIANGMPLAVYAGRSDVMDACGKDGPAIVSSTMAGEALSLAAAKACLNVFEKEDVVGHLWKQGQRIWEGLNGIFARYELGIKMSGLYPAMSFVFDNDAVKEAFMRAAFRNGVSLYSAVGYVNYSHTDADIDEALERLDRACKELV